MPSTWRRWNAVLHRDLGYLCAGLTIVYAVSGLAVNHRADWNPSYATRAEVRPLEGVDLVRGEATLERVRERAGLRQANFLHLNQPKKLWTWMADAYAVALLLLAITGLFVLRGRNGITGRGAWLTAVGVAIPAAFLLLYL